MYTLLIVLHVIFCVFLILVILLQTGKGAGIGAAFGGGSQTVFGPRGAGSFIGKLTGIVAALFMLTSLILAYLSSSSGTGVADKVNAMNEVLESKPEEVPVGQSELEPEATPDDGAKGQDASVKGSAKADAGAPKPVLKTADDGKKAAAKPVSTKVNEKPKARVPLGLSTKPKAVPKGLDKTTKVVPKGLDDKSKTAPKGLTDKPKAAPKGLDDKPKAAPEGLTGKPKAAPGGLTGKPKAAPEGLDDKPKAPPREKAQ